MPSLPTPDQSEASRRNGSRSDGPFTAAGKARSALNGIRHGLAGPSFFMLPDEDAEEFRRHEAEWLAEWRPRDHAEREAALAAVRAMWREIRGDRLEALVLGELFAAGRIDDAAERETARAAAFRQLGTLLRYQARIARELRGAMATLDALRRRRLAASRPARPDEPEWRVPALAPTAQPASTAAPVPPEPEPALNRHQRRALQARQRAAMRRAA
jgi:hypothetical protein